MNKVAGWIIGGASLVLIFLLIGYLLFTQDVNNKEAGLVSLLLTILSFVVSYITSKYFADESYKSAIEEVKEQHQANLRVYALNAAEKVGNLSSELTKLSFYLQKELEYNDEGNLVIVVNGLQERIESAIHITNTLKSINDTSLSDWRGVIGDELNERKEEELERETEIKELVSRVEDLVGTKNYGINGETNSELKEIKSELNLILGTISGNVVQKRQSSKPVKVEVKNNCPHCSSELNYRQRQNEKSFKTIKCNHCNKRFVAYWSNAKGFYLVDEIEVEKNINCPWCKIDTIIVHSNIPHTTNFDKCKNCSGKIKIVSVVNGIKFTTNGVSIKNAEIITPELIEKIESMIPKQPWPTGTGRNIATELNIPNSLVQSVIDKGIEEGKYYQQINGVLYKKVESASSP